MPTYSFIDEENDVEFEEMMSYSEKQAFLADHPHIKQTLTQINIVRSANGMRSMRNDDGWRENLARMAEAHPGTTLGNRYGDKSVKAVKTREAVEKWRRKRAAAGIS